MHRKKRGISDKKPISLTKYNNIFMKLLNRKRIHNQVPVNNIESETEIDKVDNKYLSTIPPTLQQDDVVGFDLAFAGAMGDAGGVNILAKNGESYYANFNWGNITVEELESILPVLTECQLPIIGSAEKMPDGWKHLSLGMGNNLIIRTEYLDRLIAERWHECPNIDTYDEKTFQEKLKKLFSWRKTLAELLVNMPQKEYQRADSNAFATKVSKKIAGWYNKDVYHENAVRRIVLQREEIYALLEKVEKVNVKKLLKYLDSSGFFYRPSSAARHHNFPGGLAEHSLGVFKIIEEWNSMTPEERRASRLYQFNLSDKKVTCDIFTERMNYDDMVIASICHDLCKAKHYYFDGRIIKSHHSDPELNSAHGSLSVKRLVENGIDSPDCEEIKLAVLMHMHLFSRPRFQKEAQDQIKAKKSMLAIAVWAADKLDASRHPAGKRQTIL